MATYFQGGSEIQADNLQTLYLMNPNYSGYFVSDTTHQQHQQQEQPSPPNMLLLNPSAGTNALNQGTIPHPPLPCQHFVGIPFAGPSVPLGSANPDDHGRPSLHEIPALHGLVPRVHYNLWNSVDPAAAGESRAHVPTAVPGIAPDVMSFRRPMVTAQQGLSLSLSPQHNSLTGQQGPGTMVSPTRGGSDEMRISGGSPTSVSAASNGVSRAQSVILGSKYMRAAQQLLDEVVNVGKAMKADSEAEQSNKEKKKPSTEEAAAVAGDVSCVVGESSCKRGAELTTAQRQELQMKKAKLLNMLDEVEQRYRQYHTQMQFVVASFEQAAGRGSAKSYTALALKTISKQFRCLKDAITTQIKATSKSLGEDDAFGGKGEGSRLRFVDHQLRQQRAMQQLGMMQQNAWRPQRGLPERAVSVLRAWLFENFLHPYPKDSDKHMLAKQTGLTRSQVSNWFINARVRLWKPMVEEMYLEEMKNHAQNGGSEDNASKNDCNNNKNSKDSNCLISTDSNMTRMEQGKTIQNPQEDKPPGIQIHPTNDISTISSAAASAGATLQTSQGFSLMGSSEMELMVQRVNAQKQRLSNNTQIFRNNILSMEMEIKPDEMGKDLGPKYGHERHMLLTSGALNHGFGAYQIGRFNPEQLAPQRCHGNGVSLTLGLPHCENHSLSRAHQSTNYMNPSQAIQLERRLEMGSGELDFCSISTAQSSHSSAGYEGIDIQNTKGFAAQLLPDFVA
ncbi:hypothetical protein Nepgr_000247 [Nepenthes gracilis]|uniref:Homeobox domain-containing protein n=1 Tax=Nepenthes gracilis TaxID=150966 RepID=A0AAD3P396_NEPGR|nr:hypothetical protein Nepgr_000247 [Nepenthes gracilis]